MPSDDVIAVQPDDGNHLGRSNGLTAWTFKRNLILAALVDVAFLAVAACRQPESNFNPDAVAYLQIAEYYVSWRPSLFINGYWGPMLSWIIALLMNFSIPRIAAARIVMAGSALIFLLAGARIIRAMRVPRGVAEIAVWLIALTSVPWSVQVITPDLLGSSLLLFAIAETIQESWQTDRRSEVRAGLFLGLAYLAKAVALPTGTLIAIVFGAIYACRQRRLLLLRASAVTILTMITVASPWVTAISFKYGYPTISTSGPIAHAIMAPPDGYATANANHPTFSSFNQPEPGRITSWEDPTYLPYKRWSPFASFANFRYQVHLILRNVSIVIGYISSFDYFSLGIFATIFALCLQMSDRTLRRPWQDAIVAAACLSAPFLPLYAADLRYFYGIYVLLVGVTLAIVSMLSGALLSKWGTKLLFSTTVFSFIVTSIPPCFAVVFDPPHNADFETAEALAPFIFAANLKGPIASAGPAIGNTVAFFLSYLLQRPYYGNSPRADISMVRASGAQVILVRDGSLIDQGMAGAPDFRQVSTAPLDLPVHVYAADVR